jgi:hypothetical protein
MRWDDEDARDEVVDERIESVLVGVTVAFCMSASSDKSQGGPTTVS